ncbi:MAG TPA: FtsX-like permease family protein [Ktedonobacterales bacterium]|nr:FtsX-like permease family protein [Ktedonobacterales bacterium]
MQTLFGVPLDALMQRLLICSIAAAALVVLLALRRPIFLKIGLRNVPRRRLRMVLIIFGLMLATTFISAALAVGDTISTAVRSVAVYNYGRVDEIVSGGHGALGLFPQSAFNVVRQGLAGDPDVAGIAPALEEDNLLLADETSRQVRSKVTALAIPPGAEDGFDGMYNASGAALPSSDLNPTEVYLNRTLGSLLNAKPGDLIYVYSQRWPQRRYAFHVRGIIAKSGLVGDTPTFIAPLATFQQIEHDPDGINRIFVANRGDGLSGVALSDGITERIYSTLGGDLFLKCPANGAPGDSSPGAFGACPAVVGAGYNTNQPGSVVIRLNQSARDYYNLSVNEVKENGVKLSEAADDIFTRIFTLFALFSLAIGVLLIFLIFVLLAAERRAEMGVSRAIGVQRDQLILLFLFEGSFYDLIASLIGIGVGVGLGIGIVLLLSPVLAQSGFPLSAQLNPRSLVIAYCLGALFTLGTIIASSWLISRMTIVQAMKNLPEPPRPSASLAKLAARALTRLLTVLGLGDGEEAPWRAALALPADLARLCWGLVTCGVLPLLLGALFLQQGVGAQQLPLFSFGLSLAIIGAALVLRRFIFWLPTLYHAVGPLAGRREALLRWDRRCRALGDRVAAGIAGLGLLLYWGLPYDALASLGFPRFSGGIEVFFFSGMMMVFGAIWALAFNADLLLLPVTWLLRGLRRIGFILHTALVYPLHYRFRTGVNLVMFTLVIFTMTVMAVISNSVASSYGNVSSYTGGFDIQAQPYFNAIPNIHTAIEHAPGVDPNEFASVGAETLAAVGVIQFSAPHPRWSYYPIDVVDGGFLDGLGNKLVARAPGYATDADVWKALRDHPGYALIDSRALRPPPGSPFNQFIPSLEPDQLGTLKAIYSSVTQSIGPLPGDYDDYLYRFYGALRGDTTIPATPLWINDIRGGKPIKVTVIGVVDNTDGLHYGLVTSKATFAPSEVGLPPLPVETQSYYFKMRPGADAHAAALALGSAFLDDGLETTVLADLAVNVNGSRIFIAQVLLGVVGLTLLLGVAALAVTGTRAVVERRQQIGMLRALGYQRWAVQASFLLEFLLVGVVGTLIGLALGLLLCRNVFAANFFEQYQTGLEFLVPWGELGVITLCAFAASLLAAFLPAWQAGRVAPADALRYE